MSSKTASLYRSKLAGERGAIRKDWGGRVSIALAYPNVYRVGMSNLGFQVVYDLLNRRDYVVAERVFLPEEHEMSLHYGEGKGLLSLESRSPLLKFDIIAFSLSYENDYPNILKILQMGKIPLLSAERDGPCPLVMGGGINSFLNPEPLAGFFDFFLLGEAEENLNGFTEFFRGLGRGYGSREELLKELARNVRHVYVPRLCHIEYEKDGTIKERICREKDIPLKIESARKKSSDPSIGRSSILAPDTEFADRILIETGRGCGWSCRFCAAGYVYRPPRVWDKKGLASCVDKAVEEFGRVGLLSPSVLDTPGIEEICSRITERGGDFSLASLRADLLTENMLVQMRKTGQRSLAIAPEAGSERLRRVINKHLTKDQITEAARMIAAVGDFSIKLYFLIGLPTETREDVAEIVDLVKSIKHNMIKESRARGRIGLINLSVNCFIPKAFTPFQWFPLEAVDSLREKQKWLKKAFSREGGVRISFDIPKWAYVQALLSLGDRRAGAMLMLGSEFNGDWAKAFQCSEINPDFFVRRPKGLDEILPWDFIDHGIRKEYLKKEYRLALRQVESDICHVGECDRCGVCRPE